MSEIFSKKRSSRLYPIWIRFKRNKMALFGGIISVSMIIIAIFGSFISPYDPFELNMPNRNIPPCGEHLFGTDDLGRDILSRIILGTRVSLTVGVTATFTMVLIGVTLGLVSGYYGGVIDVVLMRIVDIILAIPTFFLYILAVSMFKVRGIFVISLVMGLLRWTSLARIIRGEVLSLKERDFIIAAKALGASDRNILFSHLLPNVMALVIVTTTYRIAGFILSESGLSFLGLGDPTTCSWGGMLARGRASLSYAPWVSFFPGLMLFLMVLGFNLLGDGLRDALDPRLKM